MPSQEFNKRDEPFLVQLLNRFEKNNLETKELSEKILDCLSRLSVVRIEPEDISPKEKENLVYSHLQAFELQLFNQDQNRKRLMVAIEILEQTV